MSTTKLDNMRNHSSGKKRSNKAESFRIKTKVADQSKEKVNSKLVNDFSTDQNQAVPTLPNINDTQAVPIVERKLEMMLNQAAKMPFKLDQSVVTRLQPTVNEPSYSSQLEDPSLGNFLQVKSVSIGANHDPNKKWTNPVVKQNAYENKVREKKESQQKKLNSLSEYELGGDDEGSKYRSVVSRGDENDYASNEPEKMTKESLPALFQKADNARMSRIAATKRHSESVSPSQDRLGRENSFSNKTDRRQNLSTPRQDKSNLINSKIENPNGRFGPLEKIKEINTKKSPQVIIGNNKGPNKNYPITNSNSVFRSKASYGGNAGAEAKNLLNSKTMTQPSYISPQKPGLSQSHIVAPYKSNDPSENIFSSASDLVNNAVKNSLLNLSQKKPQPQPIVQGKNVRSLAQNSTPSIVATGVTGSMSANASQAQLPGQQAAPQGQIGGNIANASPVVNPKPLYYNYGYDTQPKKKIVYVPPPVSNKYKYIVGGGNNPDVVLRVLAKRDWWEQTEGYNTLFNLKWQQTYRGYRYDRLPDKVGGKQCVNHFEYHPEISTKDNLIKNLAIYAEASKVNLFDMTPLTFMFNMGDTANFDKDMQKFAKFFIKNHPNQNKYAQPNQSDRKAQNIWYNFDYRKQRNYQLPSTTDEKNDKKKSPYLKPIMHKTFLKNTNAWVLKPTGFNRGRGVEVFNDLETLNQLINETFLGAPTNNKKKSKKEDGNTSGSEEDEDDLLKKELSVKSQSFVIQKYIEDTLLINRRKFDIRIWTLVTQDMQLYFFKEGYLRMSSEEFSLDGGEVFNKFIHLTNNAVQKFSKDYGQHESGNQLSFNDFDQYIKANNMGGDFHGKILPRMKELVKNSMNSVGRILNQNDRKYCFELFGYDFMIDADFNVWLIEVNTNPCIEESSTLLSQLMPRMLDDAFKLTVDVIFPKPRKPAQPKGNMNSEKKPETTNNQQVNIAQTQKVSLNGESSEQKTSEIVESKEENTDKKAEGEVQEANTTPEVGQEGIEKKEDETKSSSNGAETTDTEKSTGEKPNLVMVDLANNKSSDFVRQGMTTPRKPTVKVDEPTQKETVYPVDGYTDTENMWEFLCTLQGPPQKSPMKKDRMR